MADHEKGAAVVIGGGIAGLATAALLGAEGWDVTVLEARDEIGGRAGSWEQDGFRFDTGPSWYLMPEVFDHFFRLLGTTAEQRARPRPPRSGVPRLHASRGPGRRCRPPTSARAGRSRHRAVRVRSNPARAPSSTRTSRYGVELGAGAGLDPLEQRGRVFPTGADSVGGSGGGAVGSVKTRYAGSRRTRSSSCSAVVPSRRKKWSNTSGIRYQLGPVSNRNPSCSHDPARPPTSSRASRTVTSQPSAPSSAAVASPAIPAPITIAAPFSWSAMCATSACFARGHACARAAAAGREAEPRPRGERGLDGSGTRTRSSCGVAAEAGGSAANRSWAAVTARRQSAGSSG